MYRILWNTEMSLPNSNDFKLITVLKLCQSSLHFFPEGNNVKPCKMMLKSNLCVVRFSLQVADLCWPEKKKKKTFAVILSHILEVKIANYTDKKLTDFTNNMYLFVFLRVVQSLNHKICYTKRPIHTEWEHFWINGFLSGPTTDIWCIICMSTSQWIFEE